MCLFSAAVCHMFIYCYYEVVAIDRTLPRIVSRGKSLTLRGFATDRT